MNIAMLNAGMHLLRRREEGGGCGSFGCFAFLLLVGAVIYLVMKGRRDRPEQLGAAKRAMASAPLAPHTFACPYAKCPSCGASGDKMKQQWDGLRKVAWSCGYCGSQIGVQELQDEELPPSARQRLGLDAPQAMMQGQGYVQEGPGSAVGGLLTGMMIGSMLGGSSHHHDGGSWGQDSPEGGSGGWNDSPGDGSGDGFGGGDFGGDSGGDGGGDMGGGDW